MIYFIAFLIGSITFIYTICYMACSDIDTPKLKFKTFISFYNLNPERWDYDNTLENDNEVKFTSYYPNYISCSYRFNFFDFFKFKLWKRKRHKIEKSIKENENLQKVIASIKYDIKKAEEENQKQLQKATKNIKEITRRL